MPYTTKETTSVLTRTIVVMDTHMDKVSKKPARLKKVTMRSKLFSPVIKPIIIRYEKIHQETH